MKLSSRLEILAVKHMTVQEFIEARADGAAKIAKETRAKGGVATLTAIHFEAKASAYKLALLSSRSSDAIAALKKLESVVASGISTAPDMTTFQQLTGKQEVYGEVICFLEHPQDYK